MLVTPPRPSLRPLDGTRSGQAGYGTLECSPRRSVRRMIGFHGERPLSGIMGAVGVVCLHVSSESFCLWSAGIAPGPEARRLSSVMCLVSDAVTPSLLVGACALG